MTVGDTTREIWIQRSESLEAPSFKPVPFGDRLYEIAYDVDRRPLGFELKLDDFEVGFEPGTEQATKFVSKVRLNDQSMGIKDKPHTISMNEPMSHRGFTFYQIALLADRRTRTPASGRASSSRSSRWASTPAARSSTPGCIVLVLGIFAQFYMRAGVFTDGGKRERERSRGRKAKTPAARDRAGRGRGRGRTALSVPFAAGSHVDRTRGSSDSANQRSRVPDPRPWQPSEPWRYDMRRCVRLCLLLAWESSSLAHPPDFPRPRPSRSRKPRALGVGPAYDQVGKLAVMHAGRVKPLDTVAREEVKQVFGRETIKLHDAANEVVETWGPGRRLPRLDGPARVLGRPAVHPGRLSPLAAGDPGRLDPHAAQGDRRRSRRPPPRTEGATREAGRRSPSSTAAALAPIAKAASSRMHDRKAVAELAAKLSEEHKWLTPRELEDAKIADNGQTHPFMEWVAELDEQKQQVRRQSQRRPSGSPRPSAGPSTWAIGS